MNQINQSGDHFVRHNAKYFLEKRTSFLHVIVPVVVDINGILRQSCATFLFILCVTSSIQKLGYLAQLDSMPRAGEGGKKVPLSDVL